jgi:hypothetical protein
MRELEPFSLGQFFGFNLQRPVLSSFEFLDAGLIYIQPGGGYLTPELVDILRPNSTASGRPT